MNLHRKCKVTLDFLKFGKELPNEVTPTSR